MTTMADAILEELARCRDLLGEYADLPPESSWFAVAHIKADIERMEKAMLEGDTVEMVRCLAALKDKR